MKLYILINKDVEMSSAKLAVQVGHACTSFMMESSGKSNVLDWFYDNQTKIILKAPESDLKKLEDNGYITIRDLGKTEIPANTLTCVVLGLGTKERFLEEIPKFKRWRLA